MYCQQIYKNWTTFCNTFLRAFFLFAISIIGILCSEEQRWFYLSWDKKYPFANVKFFCHLICVVFCYLDTHRQCRSSNSKMVQLIWEGYSIHKTPLKLRTVQSRTGSKQGMGLQCSAISFLNIKPVFKFYWIISKYISFSLPLIS